MTQELLIANISLEIEHADCQVVDVDLQAKCDHRPVGNRDQPPRSPGSTTLFKLSLDQQPAGNKIPDEARHCRFGEPDRFGNTGTRARPLLHDLSQHKRQVLPAYALLPRQPSVVEPVLCIMLSALQRPYPLSSNDLKSRRPLPDRVK